MRRPSPSAALAVLALLAGVLLGGCGGEDPGQPDADSTSAADQPSETQSSESQSSESESSETESESPESDSPETADEPEGECPFLDTADVTEAAGVAMKEVAGGEGGCFFSAKGDGPTVQVTPVQIAIDQDDYVKGSREACDGPVTDVEAGDAAFTCTTIGPQGYVFQDGVVVVLDISDVDDDRAALTLAGDLLPHVRL